jgi:hypothetical protein
MNIEDYTIDASAFAGLGNAATTASIDFSSFVEEVSHISSNFMGSGVEVFRSGGSLIVYDKSGRIFYLIPDVEKPMKVVFDNGMQIVDESKAGLCEDIEAASEEELDLFIKGVS